MKLGSVCGAYSNQYTQTVSLLEIPTITLTPNPSTGHFTVSWTSTPTAGAYALDEKINGGAWQIVETTGAATNIGLDRPNGSYSYRVAGCANTSGVFHCSNVSAVVTESVQASTLPQPPATLSVAPAGLPCPNTVGPRGFVVSWWPSSGASSYDLHEWSTDIAAYDKVLPTTQTSMSLNRDGAGGDLDWVTYEYEVRACNMSGSTRQCSQYQGLAQMCVRHHPSPLRPDLVTTTTYIHTDGLGSPVAETNASGAVTTHMRYEPYGAPTTGVYAQGPGYTGHVTDAATGLSYMQQRYYDPIAGRFLSMDSVPAGSGSSNRYWYANNNPFKNVDPDGRDTEWLQAFRGETVEASPTSPVAIQLGSSLRSSVAPIARGVDKVRNSTAFKAVQAAGDVVTERVSVNAKGYASAGTGLQATKNLAGQGADSIGWVPVGEGLYAGITADIKLVSLDFTGGKSSPLSYEISGDIAAVGSLGGSINIDPAGKLEISVSVGVGAGENFSYSPKLNVKSEEITK